jgi:hypothetical protein
VAVAEKEGQVVSEEKAFDPYYALEEESAFYTMYDLFTAEKYPRTDERQWAYARAWLYARLRQDDGPNAD